MNIRTEHESATSYTRTNPKTALARIVSLGITCTLFLATSLAGSASADAIRARVINGTNSSDHTPWMVSLRLQDENGKMMHICGGTLIDPTTVLTAAHCVAEFKSSPDVFEVLVGATRLSTGEGEIIPISGIVVHPDFVSGVSLKNDLAILKLERAATTTEFADPISSSRFAEVGNGSVRLYGWGVIYADVPVRPDNLQTADLPVVSDSICSERLGLDFDPGVMMCAGTLASSVLADDARDACEGDSGGPVISYQDGHPYVAGIVSWGFGCGSTKVYGVYTKVAPFEAWIRSNPAVPPFQSTTVEVTGLPEVGATLNCKAGKWGGELPLKYRYSWIDRESGILPGKNTPHLRLTRKDVGRIVSCSVLASNPGGETEVASAETSAVLPSVGRAPAKAPAAVRHFCKGQNCEAYFDARSTIKGGRIILSFDGSQSRTVKPIFASSSAVYVKYRKGSRGRIFFRLQLASGLTVLKEVTI